MLVRRALVTVGCKRFLLHDPVVTDPTFVDLGRDAWKLVHAGAVEQLSEIKERTGQPIDLRDHEHVCRAGGAADSFGGTTH